MNTLPTDEDTERALDALLARRVAIAPADFTEKTIARIRQDAARSDSEAEDGVLDALLADRPIAPSDAFTRRTVARIMEQAKRKAVLLRFPVWASSLAAAVAVGLFIGLGDWTGGESAAQACSSATLASYELAEVAQLAGAPFSAAEPLLNADTLDAIAMVSSLAL